MRKVKNVERIYGRIYQHTIELKKSKKDVDYYRGRLEIAIDEDGLDVVTVEFTYVAPTYPAKPGAQPKVNRNFAVLQSIVEKGKTWIKDGKDEATIVEVDGSLGVNAWPKDDEMIVYQRNDASFISIIDITKLPEDVSKRATFELDIVLNRATDVDGDEETGALSKTTLHGGVFDFKNTLLPVDLTVFDEGGREYFRSLELTNQNVVFTKVKGIISNTSTTKKVEVESAWGGARVEEKTVKNKNWIVTWASPITFDLEDAENGITSEELTAASQAFETWLAEQKKGAEERKASQGSAFAAAPSTPAPAAKIATEKFDF